MELKITLTIRIYSYWKQPIMRPIQPKPLNNRSTASSHSSRQDRSRTEMSLSSISTTSYPKCIHKKQHAKEMMNLICLTPTCKNRGPICSLCKTSEHSSHVIIPIKTFLTKLSLNLAKPKAEIEPILKTEESVIIEVPGEPKMEEESVLSVEEKEK